MPVLPQAYAPNVSELVCHDFTFWLTFGLSPNLGLSESLSERLIQKLK